MSEEAQSVERVACRILERIAEKSGDFGEADVLMATLCFKLLESNENGSDDIRADIRTLKTAIGLKGLH